VLPDEAASGQLHIIIGSAPVNDYYYRCSDKRRHCNVTLYNVDDFISTQIDTQIGYVQSDVY